MAIVVRQDPGFNGAADSGKPIRRGGYWDCGPRIRDVAASRQAHINDIAITVVIERPLASIGKHNRYQLPELRERDRSEAIRGFGDQWLIEGSLNRRQGITTLNGLRCAV